MINDLRLTIFDWSAFKSRICIRRDVSLLFFPFSLFPFIASRIYPELPLIATPA